MVIYRRKAGSFFTVTYLHSYTKLRNVKDHYIIVTVKYRPDL